MSESSEAGSGKARKRASSKPATGQGTAKVKATIHLSVEADERLSIHAIKMGMDRSELVEWLIQQTPQTMGCLGQRRAGRSRRWGSRRVGQGTMAMLVTP